MRVLTEATKSCNQCNWFNLRVGGKNSLKLFFLAFYGENAHDVLAEQPSFFSFSFTDSRNKL